MRLPLACVLVLWVCAPAAAARKGHIVMFGSARKVSPVVPEGELHVRPLFVDGKQTEWIADGVHAVTEKLWLGQQIMRLNNLLPGERGSGWVWQRGPWVEINRSTGRLKPVKLPDFDPRTSNPVWFRDYAAYCGVQQDPKGDSPVAVVWQLGSKKPMFLKQIPGDPGTARTCSPATWQREPLVVTIHPEGQQDIPVPLSLPAGVPNAE